MDHRQPVVIDKQFESLLGVDVVDEFTVVRNLRECKAVQDVARPECSKSALGDVLVSADKTDSKADVSTTNDGVLLRAEYASCKNDTLQWGALP